MFKNQHALIMSTLTVVLTLTACGKKTEAYKPTSAPTNKAGATSTQTASGPKSPELIPAKDIKKDDKKATADLPGSSRKATVKETVKVTKQPEVQSVDGDLLNHIDLFTGMKDLKNDLNYTGSSPDSLLGFIKAQLAKESSNVQKANALAAKSILNAQLSIDGFSGEAEVKLKMTSGDVVLKGALGTEKMNRMYSSKRTVKASIKCLDFNPGSSCVNVLAKIQTEVGTSYVILRNSIVDLHFEMDLSDSVNYSYSNLRQFFVNSIQQVETSHRLDSRRLETFEVANGRSGFALKMLGYNGEFLGFSGALVAPTSGSSVNVTLNSLKSSSIESQSLLRSGKISLKFADTVVDAKMINNNGFGQIRLALKIADLGKDDSNSMKIVASRRVKKINDVNSDLLK